MAENTSAAETNQAAVADAKEALSVAVEWIGECALVLEEGQLVLPA